MLELPSPLLPAIQNIHHPGQALYLDIVTDSQPDSMVTKVTQK
jgi:hypothetical protein